MNENTVTVKLSVNFKRLLGPFLMLATFKADEQPLHRTLFAMGRDVLSWDIRP